MSAPLAAGLLIGCGLALVWLAVRNVLDAGAVVALALLLALIAGAIAIMERAALDRRAAIVFIMHGRD